MLELLREGLTYEQIAGRLGISYDGAKYHVSEIITRLGVANRYEAARWQPSAHAATRSSLLLGALAGLRVNTVLRVVPALPIASAAALLTLLVAGILVMEARREDAFNPALGKVAFVRDGDIWVKELPDGEEKRLTSDGVNVAPQWSPSGEWILFQKTTEHGGGWGSWVIRPDGSEARHVDRTIAHWSPSEDLIAFMAWDSTAGRDHRGELVTERPDGSSRRQPAPPVNHGTTFTSRLSSFRSGFVAWSPDGRWLAFAEAVRMIPSDLQGYCDCAEYLVIKRVAADGRGGTEIIYQGEPGMDLTLWNGWSADSRFYLIAERPSASSGSNTWLYNTGKDTLEASAEELPRILLPPPQPWGPILAVPIDGSQPRRSDVQLRFDDEVIAHSRDGRTTLVVEGGAAGEWLGKRLALFDPATGRSIPLTAPETVAISPDWSPSGSQIVYVAAPEASTAEDAVTADPAIRQRRIWVMDRDGRNPRALTNDPRYRDEHPHWSADGRHVLFARIDLQTETPSLSLWLLEVATGNVQRVLEDIELTEGGAAPLWIEDRALDYWRAP